MRSRALLAAAALLAALTAAGAQAAGEPTPQIVDPSGDNVGPAGTDIRSVTFTPTRKGRSVTGFRVTLLLDAPALQTPGILYRVFGDQDNCGRFQISSAGTAALITQNQVYMTCGTTPSTTGGGNYTIINVSPVADKNTLVWTFRLKDLPKEMRSGTMSALEAFVSPADPVFGIFNTADSDRAASYDSASGKRTFTY